MRVSIIVDDNMIVVDGSAHRADCSPLIAENIHAVQWYGSAGEVEFRSDPMGDRLPNEKITDLSPYQPYIDLWQAQREIDEQRELEMRRKMEEDRRKAQALEAKIAAAIAEHQVP